MNCVELMRYMCCIRVRDGEGHRVRLASEDSLASIPEESINNLHPANINTVKHNVKQSVYKKMSTWSAYIGKDTVSEQDSNRRNFDDYLINN